MQKTTKSYEISETDVLNKLIITTAFPPLQACLESDLVFKSIVVEFCTGKEKKIQAGENSS